MDEQKGSQGWGVDGRDKKLTFGKACLAKKGRHWWNVYGDEIKVMTEWIGGIWREAMVAYGRHGKDGNGAM